MRAIKFRGKDNGHWVYGDYAHGSFFNPETEEKTTRHIIISDFLHDVDPDTVGQFTGLHDINGREIYEGDIVTMKRTPEGRRMSVTSRHVVTSNSVTDWDFHSLAEEILSLSMFNFHEKYSIYNHHVEVIGNIHENPELAQPYSLNLPERKPRKRKNNKIDVVFKFKV